MSQRLNPERYAVLKPWRRVVHHGYHSTDEGAFERSIAIDIADLLEKRSNHIWSNGAYKVTLKNVPGMRSTTFYGETAWSDAARYAHDAASACGDWRWWPDL